MDLANFRDLFFFPQYFAIFVIPVFFREDFRYDQGRKSGSSVLRGSSGAVRKGTRADGEWHGRATFTASDGEVTEENWDRGRKI